MKLIVECSQKLVRLGENLWGKEQELDKADYKEFISLVKRMREAQRNYYNDRPKVGYKVAYYNMINKETLVDEYLKKMEV